MIEWITFNELEALLERQRPLALHLRPFVHGRTLADIHTWFPHAPVRRVEDGLSEIQSWHGVTAGMPFVVTAAARANGWGFDVRLPQCTVGDAEMITAIRELGLPRFEDPYFEPLPTDGGYAVVAIGNSDESIYVSTSSSDANAVAALLSATTDRRYVVRENMHPPRGWFIAGPITGRYFSYVELFPTEAIARTQASRLATRTGFDFSVQRTR